MKDISGILDGLKSLFDSGAVFQFIAPALILDANGGRPMDHWSLSNRLWILFHGTTDARGFRQWEKVGRRVKKGAKALYILAPNMKTGTRESDEKPGEKETFTYCKGFLAVPVFCKRDTEGEDLPEYKPPQPPPLAPVAEAWGLPVHYEASDSGMEGYFGYYSHAPGEKNITLLTHDTYTWLHELCHAAHDRLGSLTSAERVDRELVAEFGAAALGRVLGLNDEASERSALAYCQSYAAKTGNAGRALMRVLDEVQRVCELILNTAAGVEAPAAVEPSLS